MTAAERMFLAEKIDWLRSSSVEELYAILAEDLELVDFLFENGEPAEPAETLAYATASYLSRQLTVFREKNP